MSLKVWLPLNGDLHNQGCTPFTVSSIEATPTFTAGKIGQCYQRTNSNSQLTNGLRIEDNLIDLFGSTASIAVWVKPLNTHTHYNGTILSSGNWNQKKWAFGVSQDNTKVDVLCGSYNTYINCTVPVNEWTHLVSIYDNGTCTLYKNGAYIGQLTGQKVFETDATWTGICRETYAGGYFGFCGCINDLRIYDHCLSAAEVREISQGLVLHYKLDSPFIENTINYTPSPYKESYSAATPAWDTSKHTNAIIPNNWGQGYNGGVADPSHGYHAMWNIIDGIPTIVLQNHNSIINQKNRWMGVSSAGISIAIAANVKYTISYEQRTLDTLGGYTTCGLYYKYNSSASNNFHDGCPKIGQNTVVNTWERFSYTFTRKSTVDGTGTNGSIYIYGHNGTESTMQVRNIQLEIKDHATGYTITERNNQIIEDSSGYNHNGTITGTISTDSDSPRYQSSIYINGSSYILTPAGSFAWNDLTQLTFSAWMKPTASMTGWRGSVGIAADSNQTARGIAITDYGNEFRGTYTNGSGYQTVTTGKTLPQNEWHHCAGTLNGTEFKLYFDGALVKTQTIDWGTATLNANARFEVGVDLPGTDEKFTGNYSDIRCYCTALDADAIRQLYEVGAKIDNKQSLHTFEINELSSNIFRSELIMPWAKPNRTRIGEIVEHNGYMALNIAPEPFYNNISSTTSGALDGMFQAGSYVFDIWVDVDSVISGGTNRAGGMIIRYSDNTSENAFVFTGGNLGYQHKIYITPANKTVQRLEFYYYTSTDVFYRIDSCIYPINETKIFKSGIVQSGGFLEDTKSRIIKNSLVEINEIIEL